MGLPVIALIGQSPSQSDWVPSTPSKLACCLLPHKANAKDLE